MLNVELYINCVFHWADICTDFATAVVVARKHACILGQIPNMLAPLGQIPQSE